MYKRYSISPFGFDGACQLTLMEEALIDFALKFVGGYGSETADNMISDKIH